MEHGPDGYPAPSYGYGASMQGAARTDEALGEHNQHHPLLGLGRRLEVDHAAARALGVLVVAAGTTKTKGDEDEDDGHYQAVMHNQREAQHHAGGSASSTDIS